MAKINQEELLKEFEFYTRLINEHEANAKNALQKTQNSNNLIPEKHKVKYQPHPYKPFANYHQPSFSQKHLIQANNFSIPNKKNRILINKSINNKYVMQKNKNSSTCNSNLNSNIFIDSLVPVNKKLHPKVKSDKNKCHLELIEEIESLTRLIKKKTSENSIKNKLSACLNNTSSCNKYKTVNGGNVFSTNKIVSNISSKNIQINMPKNMKQNECTVNLNQVPLKQFNGNKYYYKKSDSKVINTHLNAKSQDPSKYLVQKRQIVNKAGISISKNINKNSCFSLSKQNQTAKLNKPKDSILLCNKFSTKSFTLAKVKAPSQLPVKTLGYKSPKISKLNSCGSSYTIVNKHPITLKSNSFRCVTMPKSVKKCNKKLNTTYKVINKNKRLSNEKLLNHSKSELNRSITVEESDSFLKELNNSAMDKLEKDLLAISTAFTATPISNGTEPCSPAKANLKSNFHKTSLKKPKSKVSKYKIVNASNKSNCDLGKKSNIANLRTANKKFSCSKYKLVNKSLKPEQVFTPKRQGKSVLVKRIFKSKNALINKNASSTSFSAKIIKSKYLTLSKRKFPLWMKNDHYSKTQPQKFKGYYIKAKLPFRQKNALAWKDTRKFPSYHDQSSSRQFCKNRSVIAGRKKMKNGYSCSPVLIRGVKYSINSSGKTLKKIWTPKGHMTKILHKTFLRSPEYFKSPNLASRVLHRSINRILTASTKKSLTKVNTYCMFYNRFGRCNRGIKCTYIHDPSKIAVCTRFLRGTCKVDGCPFSHEISPGKMAVCSFFLVGACEKENCPYRHEELLPDAVLCKAFVQGYCPKGKECKKAHILVCPKYIQGECDKGSSCAFPHPPKKVKKNVQKDNEEVEKKQDVFMEKVGRYFQNESSDLSHQNKLDETKANQYLPKQRKLEEQPSFIPLFDSPQTSH